VEWLVWIVSSASITAMVSTRSSTSSRSSARARKPRDNTWPVEDTMEDKVEASDDNTEEVNETVGEDNIVPETEEVTSKNDLNCKKCVEENEGGSSRRIDRKESQVRFNDVVETHEVETEYDKPDRTLNFLKGFGKRVILCTLLIFIAKTAWPRLQPIVWPEEPVKEGKLYVLTDRSFRGHIRTGDHFVMMYAPWCGHCAKLKPDWEKLAKASAIKDTRIGKVDCTANKMTCDKYEVKGYPTLLYFRNGELLETYTGSKTVESLKEYLRTMKHKQTVGNPQKPSKKTPKKDGAKSGKKKTSKSEL